MLKDLIKKTPKTEDFAPLFSKAKRIETLYVILERQADKAGITLHPGETIRDAYSSALRLGMMPEIPFFRAALQREEQIDLEAAGKQLAKHPESDAKISWPNTLEPNL